MDRTVTIYDNGGETFDRYTVIFPDGGVLGIGETGNVPNGFCMHVGSTRGRSVVEGPHLGEIIQLSDMTPAAQAAVENEWRLIERLVRERLEYLRSQIEAERISYAEMAELQEYAEYIEEGDVQLLEWAGVEEHAS